jgi:outer membrane protein TolC
MQVAAAKATRLPSLDAGAQVSKISETPVIKTDLLGQNFRVPVLEENFQVYDATMTIPIYTGGRISQGIAAASSANDAAKYMETTSEHDLKLQVAEAYVNVLRASSALRVAKSHEQTLESHKNDVDNLVEQGMAARNAQLSVEAALLDAGQQVLQAENALNLARAAYNRVLGRPLDQAVNLEEISPESTLADLDGLTSLAQSNRTELKAVDKQSAALSHQSAATKGEALPQVGVSAGYQHLTNQYLSPNGEWQVTVGAKWNVFDGGSSRKRAAAIEMQAITASEQRKELSTQITLQVRQSWLDLQSTQSRIAVTESGTHAANENLRVARDRYANGLATYTEVLDAETMRALNEANHSNAVYDAVMAGLRLKHATGSL